MATVLRTLIIEDSEDDLLLLLRELKHGGYDMEYARVDTREQMVTEMEEKTWDLILSDYNLPTFSGVEALKVCRERDPDIPFIVISGAVGEEVAVGLMKSGAHDFVRKDNMSRLVPAIERELKEARMRRERRLAEQALRESEEKYRALVDSSPDAILSLDENGVVLSYNAAAARIWGIPAEDVLGKQLLDCEILANSSKGVAMAQLKAALADENRLPYELVTLHRNGEEVFVEANSLLMRESQTGRRVQMSLRDVTERQKLESQLQLSQKMEAIGQLAGGVAHDFNNQLSGIIGCAEILRSEVAGNEELCWFVDTISTAAEQAAGLTRQLLAFARKNKYQSSPVHIHKVIAEVVPLLEHTLDRRIRIEQELSASPDLVLGDPSQLQNAILNLAVNARDAMPDGGTLAFTTETQELDSEFCRNHPNDASPGKYLHISVTDTGEGIDESTMPHIFEPFFTTKPIGKGTGLGLSAVYGTVKSHSGTVAVESAPGAGSTFSLYLPLNQEAGITGTVAPSTDNIRGTGHILIIDDEDIVRSIGERMLRRLGYEVTICADGNEGCKLLEEMGDQIDLVILDMVMPEVSGRDTFFLLTAIKPDVRVLVASGHVMSEDIQELLDAGAVDFVQKPFRINTLSERVAAALQTT